MTDWRDDEDYGNPLSVVGLVVFIVLCVMGFLYIAMRGGF